MYMKVKYNSEGDNMDLREELMVKILTTFNKDYGVDLIDARNKLVFILNDYNVDKVCTALVASDIHEKLYLFLAVKKIRRLKKGSLENYRNVIVDFSRYILKPVNQIETNDIRHYLAIYHEHVKATTLNSKLSKLRAFFGWLHSEKYIESNPAFNIEPAIVEERIRKGLTLEQMELLRTCCITKREKAIVEFAYTTGCRVSEISKVNIADLNFDEMSLYVIGKGDKEREVYFNERAKIIINDYLNSRSDVWPTLFAKHKGVGGIGRNTILREISRVGKRMSPPLRTYPHLLRHTFATHAINAGIPIEVVQELLGHESPATTIIYAKLSNTKIKQEYRKL
ncbi:MAG TPA: tyrosine-type recombinase/integrase [Epulopiscium sp.]|nr:tyrosine-type recombinase/integrase [Candidatus Epulonipiscium sp.]